MDFVANAGTGHLRGEAPMKSSHKASQKATFTPRPLSIEQRNAIPLLCTGATDADVAHAVGVAREMVWSWRHEVPLFMAELERQRAAYIRTAVDTLRSALPKAVANVITAVEEGNLKASFELLRAVGLWGNAEAFKPGEMDPSTIALRIVRERLANEGVAKNGLDAITEVIDRNPAYERRQAELYRELESIIPCDVEPPCSMETPCALETS